ncbi:unnamed protein product [Chrysodeixis includens]|uniref:E3 ubiquitin-protein ligase n=1 Tax=Chrysodeixis includens TaxID=689277 RepID=A0A9P0BWZ5_CHRIL|nr:unnamed protein product [Chrysodeixis includens]
MGNDLSSDETRGRNAQRVSQQEVRRLLENQRREYERRCHELLESAVVAAETAQRPPPSIERNRAPYNYTTEDLRNIDRSSSQTPSGSSGAHNLSNKPNSNPAHDFVFVKNPQKERQQNRAPSAPPAPRQRSQSRHRNRSAAGGELDCKTCGAPYGVTIFQCGQGHSSCELCKAHGRNCGLCGMALTDMRNYVLEDYVSQTKGNCPHAEDGCKLVLKVSEMESHVRECPFRTHRCPLHPRYANCVWSGKLRQLSDHFERYHRDQWQDRKGEEGPEMQLLDILSNSREVFLMVQGFFNFLFHIEVSEATREIYMAVQLIGTRNSAEKWIYEIHVFNKNECRRKYTFIDNCTSNIESVKDIFEEKRCAVLPAAYASTFVNNGNVSFKLFIKCISERKPGFNNSQRGRVRN